MINLTDYNDFFLFLGSVLIIGGILYFLFRHSLQNIFISEEEISKLKISKQAPVTQIIFPISLKNTDSQALMKKLSVILLIVIIGAFLFNQFLMWRMNSSGFLSKLFNINITVTKK
ncbi:hypothetical protein A2778_05515 [Candidatus Daviesbacteria bacterium RIFCSPHIGHO2_01_FULL_40_24]|nr:MAG: hypothetical protein UT45_C0001G0104 [Candidatus Daviesbacteria bacterium GW2011_GWA2_39_33]OGE21614.1 MAG: hypothetical protein A2778_05515 [Candidatus Daviesbacteria bacterium RIFCSPHIGHO2_01_FULL_40_24]OGE30011.1 MAG: hypothetical protein A3C29_01220 [Candidatus Daviesbacteria bacterium RIFCSPHIGHO2_02_FULL_40_16]OGE43554.1 MAG: hypothetical protein A3A53_02895 [Candidatus Daviesbacteria bacterium RIFCSPLOWO2_01_FULL_39_23]OGE67827.1 MAG: hypothetical protein A3J16_02785 [Candidatus 